MNTTFKTSKPSNSLNRRTEALPANRAASTPRVPVSLKVLVQVWLGLCVAALPVAGADKSSKVIINADGVLKINGKKVFHIGFDLPPPAGAKAWNGTNAIAELRAAGATFLQTGPGGKERWTDAEVLKREQAWFDAAARHGILNEGRTLRYPTFPEQRFMTYQAIITGARGIIYFGGQHPKALTPEDAKLGWNWQFWRRVLRPVVEKIGEHSPLYPALVAAESRLSVRVSGDSVDFCVREVGDDIFVLACKREGVTLQAEFTGLPSSVAGGEVLFESPRQVVCKGGTFKDWFGPFEVHVYRFRR